jgi:N-acylneuraminate cytidylyltransferase
VTVLAVIPARGGSRAVPRKNVAVVGGVSLVARAVAVALAAETIDRVVVSTDDDEIAGAATAAGAEVVRRPPELAGDEASTESALLHVLDTLGGVDPEYVVTLEPTSPFRTAETVDECVRRARELQAAALITVSETREVLGRIQDGVFVPLQPDQPRRRQLREPVYKEAGAAYVTRTEHLRRSGSVLAEPTYAVVVSETEGLDVNTATDLTLARVLAET